MKTAARRVITGSRVSDDAQRNGRDAVARLNASAFDGATLIDAEEGATDGSGLAFTAATARSIAHNLGRAAVGWLEVYGVDTASAAKVGLFSSAHPAGISSETHVTVTPTSTGTCFLVVF